MSDRQNWKPLEIHANRVGARSGVNGLVSYLEELAGELDEMLVERQAIVFRGFDVTEESFDTVLERLLPQRLPYVQGNTPRSKVGDNIYTSTEYPEEYTISMHNELSYARSWPDRLAFFCAKPASVGGATPVVDGAFWLESLDAKLRAAFEGGVRYTQYLHDGFGLGNSWQTTFDTNDVDEVEGILSAAEAVWEWTDAGGLRVSQVRPSTIEHPVSGVEVWFNQVDQWHPAALQGVSARELSEVLPEDEMPQSVSFADGTVIPAQYAIEVRDTGLACAVDVRWQKGDVLLIDNVAVGHGRRSFSGGRRVLVAMSG